MPFVRKISSCWNRNQKRLGRSVSALALLSRLSSGDLLSPGHPLSLAVSIMCVCAGFQDADRLGDAGLATRLSVTGKPVSANQVKAALEILRIGADGGSASIMISAAHLYWVSDESLPELDRQKGASQAKGLESDFRELVGWWFRLRRRAQRKSEAIPA
jgi:hypothetical protein